jgi:hypothetical protein
LKHFADDLGARAARQFREFRKRLGSRFGRRASAPFKAGENGPFGRLCQRNRGVQPSALEPAPAVWVSGAAGAV